ncbi:MAG: DUF3737 family protein [Erysipelotrichaceae bacterium]|nr:DUF3737 family protein [Erysipelotrichaceae bacterium]
MNTLKQGYYTGERALFQSDGLKIDEGIFADGESPLKESKNIEIDNSIFKWKYPLWYCQNIEVKHTTSLDTAISGIWYTNHICISDSMIEAPKTFRRGQDITLVNVDMPNAEETFWNCKNIHLNNVHARGDYYGMNSEDIEVDRLYFSGNYCFDGGKNIVIRNSQLNSKDAFWNCENVTVYDSIIIGEYLGWNSKNLTFVNCTKESLQGLCYIEGLKMENCRLINTTLAFEFCKDIDADICSHVDSIMNPISGKIIVDSVGEYIHESDKVDVSQTTLIERDKMKCKECCGRIAYV